jgi:hypothetical protein
MKKFFYLMSLCLCMFAGVAVMTSCGDDDDELNPGEISYKTGITEKGNTLQLTITAGSVYTERYTATFGSDDKCIKFIEEMIYSKKDYADLEWQAIQAEYQQMPDELKKYSKDGKTITIDETETWKGRSRSEVREYFEMIQEEFERHSNYDK